MFFNTSHKVVEHPLYIKIKICTLKYYHPGNLLSRPQAVVARDACDDIAKHRVVNVFTPDDISHFWSYLIWVEYHNKLCDSNSCTLK